MLRAVSRLLTSLARQGDSVARWGGEEFVVVARDLSRDATGELAERIRKRLERHAFHLPSGETLLRTCSVGFSLLPFSVEAPLMLSWEHALSLADHALYRAKAAGRNCVVGVTSGEVAAANAEALMGALKDFDEALSLGLIRLSYSRPALSAE